MPDGSCAVYAGLMDGGSRVILYATLLDAALAVVAAARPRRPGHPIGQLRPLLSTAREWRCPFGDLFGNADYSVTVTDDGRLLMESGPRQAVLLHLASELSRPPPSNRWPPAESERLDRGVRRAGGDGRHAVRGRGGDHLDVPR
jgi:hypothetical protein